MAQTEGEHELIPLAAGPLTLQFDPASGFVRYVRWGEAEVLRGIYVAVRDRNWGTVEPAVTDLRIRREGHGFQLELEVVCSRREIDFAWRGSLIGTPAGTIRYELAGRARSTFLRNRIGFCVLHPLRECAGRPCTVETVEGRQIQGEFPREISPHQPFQNVQSITHDIHPGGAVSVAFAGDVFETEDQRNWSDASFKTYCTPLARPFPLEIRAGTEIRQSVTLTLTPWPGVPVAAAAAFPAARPVLLNPGPTARLPRLGLCASSQSSALTIGEAARLRALRLDHLRADIDLADSDFFDRLARAAAESQAIGAPLHVGIRVNPDPRPGFARIRAALREHPAQVSAWLIFGPDRSVAAEPLVTLARRELGGLFPSALFGTGTLANFAELNRSRPSPEMDLLVYAVSPQVHAFDLRSLVETLEAQEPMAASARRFAGRAAIAVGPVTLKPRFNPVATAAETPPLGELPPQVDPRQTAPWLAAWTLGSIAQLARGGAVCATYFETVGWLGVMETAGGCPLPERFPSQPGELFPVYHVFAALAPVAGDVVRLLDSSEPLAVRGLADAGDPPAWLLAANLTSRVQRVELPPRFLPGRWRLLPVAPPPVDRTHSTGDDLSSAARPSPAQSAGRQPWELAPCATMKWERVD